MAMSDDRQDRTRAEVERDVSDEVSFHIEASVRDLMRSGLDPDEARAEALRRFGSVSGVQHRLRAMGRRRARRRRTREWLDAARQDVRFAFRNLRRHPLFGVSMVAILGLGVAVNAAVFRVVDGALLRPLPFPDGDRVVRVFAGDTFDERVSMSVPEFRDWVSEVEVAESSVASYQTGRTLVRSGSEPEAVGIGVIEGDIAGVLGMRAVIGRVITPAEIRGGARIAMLDESTWRGRYGGRTSVLGETLSFPGESYTIVGVLPSAARTALQLGALEAWIPLVDEEWMVRGTHFIRVAARLRPGLTLVAARSSVDATMQSLIDAGTTDHSMQLVGVREQTVGASRPALFVLGGAVALVLLIVCANLTNLFHAHALGRSGEFAVRASLGAGRGRLARQIMTEGVVLGVAGGVVGLLLSRVLAGVVAAATGGAARFAARDLTDLRVAGFSLGAAVVCGALIGAWPAMRSGGAGLAGALKDGVRTVSDRGAWRRRRWLIGAEVALSVILVAGAALMVRSVTRLLDRDPGFEAEGVLSLGLVLPATRYDEAATARFYLDLMAAIRRLPGVTVAGAISHLPLGGSDTNGGFSIPGREFPDDQRPHTKKRVVTPGFFETMRIPVVAGRLPAETDRSDAADVAVISESLAKQYWPDGDAVGQRVSFSWGPPGEQQIIGVVGDILHDGLDIEAGPTLYRTHQHFSMEAMTVMVRTTGDPLGLVAPTRQAIRGLDAELPLTDVQTMESVVAISIGDRSRLMRLLAGFAGIALLLAALGVYAVASQGVQQRRREIGVRIAVGADARSVLAMIARQELLAVVLGLVAGIAGALAATRVLEASLFGVSARDPVALATAAILLGLAAAIAIIVPARRAARTEPASVLREG
jgi:predicted permease